MPRSVSPGSSSQTSAVHRITSSKLRRINSAGLSSDHKTAKTSLRLGDHAFVCFAHDGVLIDPHEFFPARNHRCKPVKHRLRHCDGWPYAKPRRDRYEHRSKLCLRGRRDVGDRYKRVSRFAGMWNSGAERQLHCGRSLYPRPVRRFNSTTYAFRRLVLFAAYDYPGRHRSSRCHRVWRYPERHYGCY